MADAAATSLPMRSICRDIPTVLRVPARELAPDNDLGDRLVTQDVGASSPEKSPTALSVGEQSLASFFESEAHPSACAESCAGETATRAVSRLEQVCLERVSLTNRSLPHA